jgi:hypothetical protein
MLSDTVVGFIGRNCASIVDDYLRPLPPLPFLQELCEATRFLKESLEHKWYYPRSVTYNWLLHKGCSVHIPPTAAASVQIYRSPDHERYWLVPQLLPRFHWHVSDQFFIGQALAGGSFQRPKPMC